MAYSSSASFRNRHVSEDNPITQRREVRCIETGKLVNFISREVVDQIQTDIKLKLLVIEDAGMLTLDPWSEL